jgi:hypothetical protein
MMNISPLALSLLLQFAPESAVGNPPVVLYDAAVAEPFPARAVPPAWRVRRAVSVAPAPPLPGRSIAERLDTLEDSVSNLLIAQSPLWHPGPRVKLVADAAPPAERGEVGRANVGMPPPDTAERGEVLDRLQAIEAKVGAVLQKLEGLLRPAAPAPPVGAAPPARSTAIPPSGVPTVHVLADRYGRQWDDSVSGYDGLVRWVAGQNARSEVAAPPMLYGAFPQAGATFSQNPGIFYGGSPYGGQYPVVGAGLFTGGSSCGPGGCGPSGFVGRGLLGGLWR